MRTALMRFLWLDAMSQARSTPARGTRRACLLQIDLVESKDSGIISFRTFGSTSGAARMSGTEMPVRRQELFVFLFFTVVLAPLLSIAIVGGYGFAIWMYQLLSGPPSG